MVHIFYKNVLIALCLFCSNLAVGQNEWFFEEDYTIRFSTRSAEGFIRGLKGDILFDRNALSQSRVNLSVDVSTISTGNKLKNKHAMGEAWFDAVLFPIIVLKSEAITKSENGYLLNAILTLKGFSKKVNIPFTFKDSTDKKAFAGQFSINREDFGISGPALAFMVGEEVTIDFSIRVSTNSKKVLDE